MNVSEFRSGVIRAVDEDTKTPISAYRIFQRADGKRLVFYPVPKNANSSFKRLLAEYMGIHDRFEFFDDDAPMVDKRLYAKKDSDKDWLWNFLPPKPKFAFLDPAQISYRIAVARDPVERFFSAYKNRILWHKDEAFGGLTSNQVVDELEQGNFENKHFLPQSYFLGASPAYFTHLSLMPDLSNVLDGVAEFFGQRIEMPRLQTRHGEADNSIDKDDRLIERIRAVYSSDYEFIKSAQF